MIPLITQLFAVLGPIALRLHAQYIQAHPGQTMTDEQLLAEFNKNIDTILAEGAAWTSSHPKPAKQA